MIFPDPVLFLPPDKGGKVFAVGQDGNIVYQLKRGYQQVALSDGGVISVSQPPDIPRSFLFLFGIGQKPPFFLPPGQGRFFPKAEFSQYVLIFAIPNPETSPNPPPTL